MIRKFRVMTKEKFLKAGREDGLEGTIFKCVFQLYSINTGWTPTVCQLDIVISIRATKIEKHGSHLPVSKIGVEFTER